MKLASIELITEITSHPNADKLDLAKVLGYTCIVGKDEFKAGDAVVLIQPDTILPEAPWAEFFKKRGSRVKAMRLRGVWSFGIVMSPYKIFAEDIGALKFYLQPCEIGNDISERIGVTKYEAPPPSAQDAKGPMPVGLIKTDEERYQNIIDIPFGELVDVSLKIDGSSATYFCKRIDPALVGDDAEWKTEVGVCSRSLELKRECSNPYTRIEQKYDILNKLEQFCLHHGVSLALRGEVYGTGIQAGGHNPHSKMPLDFAIYSVYNLDTHEYENKDSEFYYINIAKELEIPYVPTFTDVELTPELIKKYAEEDDKFFSLPFEGVVIKHHNGSFKVMNLAYDEKK